MRECQNLGFGPGVRLSAGKVDCRGMLIARFLHASKHAASKRSHGSSNLPKRNFCSPFLQGRAIMGASHSVSSSHISSPQEHGEAWLQASSRLGVEERQDAVPTDSDLLGRGAPVMYLGLFQVQLKAKFKTLLKYNQ